VQPIDEVVVLLSLTSILQPGPTAEFVGAMMCEKSRDQRGHTI